MCTVYTSSFQVIEHCRIEYLGVEFLEAGEKFDLGLSVHNYDQSLGSLDIRPCLNGPFELPGGYKLASPVYLVESSKKGIAKLPFSIQIKHCANLLTQQDCEEMAFVNASTNPHRPVYIFNEVQEGKTSFKAQSQIGEIELQHFCWLAVAKKFLLGKNDKTIRW